MVGHHRWTKVDNTILVTKGGHRLWWRMAETRLTKNRCCGRLRRNSCPRSDDRQSFPSGNLGSKNLSTKAFPGRFCSIVFPSYQLPGKPTGQLWSKETLIVPIRMTTRKGFVYALLSVYNRGDAGDFPRGSDTQVGSGFRGSGSYVDLRPRSFWYA